MNQRIFPITMPKWGIEMQQGTITEWHAMPGIAVTKGTPLLDVETDKIVNSVEAPVDGTLRVIVADKGATENVGALIAVLADAAVSDEEVQSFIRSFKPANAGFGHEDGSPPAAVSPAPAPTSAPAGAAAAPIQAPEGEARVSPIARRVAERLGVDISQVKGTGRNGRVSKEDVEAFAAAQASSARTGVTSPASAGAAAGLEPRRVKLTAMRAAIAKRLLESKQTIPHYRLTADVDFTALISRREAVKASGSNVSLNDFLIRAAGLALIKHPLINSHLVGDEILTFPRADICVAVSTDGGLVTPIVRGAQAKSAAQIGVETRALAHRARAGNLTREEISGGTFTISNLGMFGIDRFDAIINPPQVAILAVGAVGERVVARNGTPTVVKAATLTLSADHRVVDGAAGAEFLASLKALIESARDL